MPKKYKERKFIYIFSENEESRENVKEDFTKFIYKLWWTWFKKGLLSFELLLIIVFIILLGVILFINLFTK